MSAEITPGLFEVFGIELEYMIVRNDDLRILPVADRLLAAESGAVTSDVEFDDITWSNELALHVIELKVTEPVTHLARAAAAFPDHVCRINHHLGKLGARLMPTGMHPTMDPRTEARLWPHNCNPIYETFHRIFDCRGHGWANLQSIHLNLPFADDEEFGRLHAAVRLILPILPCLAASSPIADGAATGFMDTRLAAYRTNCARIPSVTGLVIPEPVFSADQYQAEILDRIYRDLEPHDPEGVIRHEWVNARGAIARFDRNTIEIRLIDSQESPAADLAVVAAVSAVLGLLVAETWSDLASQKSWPAENLAAMLDEAIRAGEHASFRDERYLDIFGWQGPAPCTGKHLWQYLLKEICGRRPDTIAAFSRPLDVMVRRGTLSSAILRSMISGISAVELDRVYRRLCHCLASNTLFLP